MTISALKAAALRLVSLGLDPDRLFRVTREERDELEAAGVAERQSEQYAARSLRFFTRPNGISHASWEMDPETAASFRELYDRATSPRRGEPRFVTEGARGSALYCPGPGSGFSGAGFSGAGFGARDRDRGRRTPPVDFSNGYLR